MDLLQTASILSFRGFTPDQVFADIAANSEFFAASSKESQMNMVRTSIKARQLGLTLSDIAGIQSTLLDFSYIFLAVLKLSNELSFSLAFSYVTANYV